MVFADALLVFMLGLQFGQYRMMIDNSLAIFTGQMQVQHRGYHDEPYMHRTIADADRIADQIREESGQQAVTVRGYGFALVSSASRTIGAQVSGVDPAHEAQVSTIPGLVADGHYLSQRNSNEAVVGNTLARNLKIDIGDELTLLGSGRDGSVAATVLPVVGIFDSGSIELDRHMLEIPLDTFRDVFAMGGHAHAIVIGGDRSAGQALGSAARSSIAGSDELELLSWEQLLPGLKQAIQADFTSAWIMYALLIVLVAFSMLNTMLMSVLERTHEFGILLALGVRHSRLGRMIVVESLVMSVIGMLLGVAAGAAVLLYLQAHGFSYPGMEEMAERFNMPPVLYPELSWRSLLPGPLAVLLASMVAAFYPIWHMRKLQPVEAIQAA
jgi:ABC-type lipoprotein release transport system permease subunit